jgi:hypothetical protein
MLKNSQKCSNTLKYVQICSNMFKYVQKCSKMLKYAQICPNMLKYAQICSNMVEDAQKCSKRACTSICWQRWQRWLRYKPGVYLSKIEFVEKTKDFQGYQPGGFPSLFFKNSNLISPPGCMSTIYKTENMEKC